MISRRISKLAVLIASIFFVHAGYCTAPSKIRLPWTSVAPFHYSVSADGRVFAISVGENGETLVRSGGEFLKLPPVPPSQGGSLRADEHKGFVALNPDGRYIMSTSGSDFIIRTLPGGQIEWRGSLERMTRPGVGLAYFFEATSHRLRIIESNSLLTFNTEAAGIGKLLSTSSISFVPEGHTKWVNFVQSAAFSSDGLDLFLGNMDGEVLSINLRVRSRMIGL